VFHFFLSWYLLSLNLAFVVQATVSDLTGDGGTLSVEASEHFHSPYDLPTVVCQRRSVPSSEPDAYSSPSGEKRTQCTGPKWPEQVVILSKTDIEI